MLVDPTPARHERLCDGGQVRPWVNARLAGKTNTGPAHERHRVDVLSVEAKVARERGVLIQASRLVSRIVVERRVQESINPLETDIEAVLSDHLIDPGDGREPGIPDSLRVGATEPFHEFAQTR